jgi:hypothetical protein
MDSKKDDKFPKINEKVLHDLNEVMIKWAVMSQFEQDLEKYEELKKQQY